MANDITFVWPDNGGISSNKKFLLSNSSNLGYEIVATCGLLCGDESQTDYESTCDALLSFGIRFGRYNDNNKVNLTSFSKLQIQLSVYYIPEGESSNPHLIRDDKLHVWEGADQLYQGNRTVQSLMNNGYGYYLTLWEPINHVYCNKCDQWFDNFKNKFKIEVNLKMWRNKTIYEVYNSEFYIQYGTEGKTLFPDFKRHGSDSDFCNLNSIINGYLLSNNVPFINPSYSFPKEIEKDFISTKIEHPRPSQFPMHATNLTRVTYLCEAHNLAYSRTVDWYNFQGEVWDDPAQILPSLSRFKDNIYIPMQYQFKWASDADSEYGDVQQTPLAIHSSVRQPASNLITLLKDNLALGYLKYQYNYVPNNPDIGRYNYPTIVGKKDNAIQYEPALPSIQSHSIKYDPSTLPIIPGFIDFHVQVLSNSINATLNYPPNMFQYATGKWKMRILINGKVKLETSDYEQTDYQITWTNLSGNVDDNLFKSEDIGKTCTIIYLFDCDNDVNGYQEIARYEYIISGITCYVRKNNQWKHCVPIFLTKNLNNETQENVVLGMWQYDNKTKKWVGSPYNINNSNNT